MKYDKEKQSSSHSNPSSSKEKDSQTREDAKKNDATVQPIEDPPGKGSPQK